MGVRSAGPVRFCSYRFCLTCTDALYYNSITNLNSPLSTRKLVFKMQCLRCGRETEEGQVFCFACEALMTKHPVKPNTVVTIHERSVRERNAVPRKSVRPEEDIDQLRRTIMQLRLWVCMLMAALMLCVAVLTWQELTREEKPAIGQNYSSIIESTADQ